MNKIIICLFVLLANSGAGVSDNYAPEQPKGINGPK